MPQDFETLAREVINNSISSSRRIIVVSWVSYYWLHLRIRSLDVSNSGASCSMIFVDFNRPTAEECNGRCHCKALFCRMPNEEIVRWGPLHHLPTVIGGREARHLEVSRQRDPPGSSDCACSWPPPSATTTLRRPLSTQKNVGGTQRRKETN